jgi:hypothetical protein
MYFGGNIIIPLSKIIDLRFTAFIIQGMNNLLLKFFGRAEL